MIITQKAIPRRTVLRGLGATLALPLLDSMTPAFAAPAKPILRFGAIYVPNGMIMRNFHPATVGTGFELTPILEPLKPFRDRMVVYGGLSNEEAYAWPREGVGDHSRGPTSYLTGLHAKKVEAGPRLLAKGGDVGVGASIDQVIAKAYAGQTQLPSLELCIDSGEMRGACDPGYGCAYQRTISWRTPTTPNPAENNPRIVFERLFGGSGTTDPAVRLAYMKTDRSLLDSVLEKVTAFKKRLGPGDTTKLDEYLGAVRDVEQRIQMAERQSDRELPLVDQPPGIPTVYGEHAKLLFDLQALAFQTDLTRAFTFLMGTEVSGRSYPEIGVPDGHHSLSHNVVDPDAIAKYTKLNAYHLSFTAQFLEKLKGIPDGEGTLLDHMVLMYGAGISNANVHSHHDLPIVTVGTWGGRLKGGQYLRYPKETPMANLHLALLDKFGMAVERFGDSTGRLAEL